jgi:molybdopterin biosynthesis enzyme
VSTFRPGTRCDDRVRALLLAAGIEALELGPRLRVGFAALGDELVDLGTVLSTGTATELGASPRHDLTTYWLGEALKRLGVEAVPLGILPDEPRLLAKRIFHASERKLDLLLLVGGLGNGVTDRTTEALRREGARILFHRVQLDGCTNVLFAKTLGLEVIGLSGKPLEAAAGFDLFVRPAVLARLGASDSLWDWSRFTWPLAGQEPPPASCESADTTLWSARPATLMPQPGHGGCVHYWTAPSFELPTVPNQDGWALVGTANVPDSTPQRAYYQPLDQHQHNK